MTKRGLASKLGNGLNASREDITNICLNIECGRTFASG